MIQDFLLFAYIQDGDDWKTKCTRGCNRGSIIGFFPLDRKPTRSKTHQIETLQKERKKSHQRQSFHAKNHPHGHRLFHILSSRAPKILEQLDFHVRYL